MHVNVNNINYDREKVPDNLLCPLFAKSVQNQIHKSNTNRQRKVKKTVRNISIKIKSKEYKVNFP